MLAELLSQDIFVVFLVFARTGSALMLMPGFGETYVNPRIRLMLAVAISLLVTPAVAGNMPPMPAAPVALLLLLAGEIIIGLFLGAIGRILLMALNTAGTVVAFQSGMANAFVQDPTVAQQASLPAMFLTTTGLLLIFVTNLHHVMLRAMVDSYVVFTPGVMPPIDDFSLVIARLVADSFILGIQLAGPFIAVGLVFYLGVGLLNRLMPQVHMFFIALPMQIILGITVLGLTISALMMWFLGRFQDFFSNLLGAV